MNDDTPDPSPLASKIGKLLDESRAARAERADEIATPSGAFPVATGSGQTEKKVTIGELEALLASDEKLDIEIQPDGSIRAVPAGTANNAKPTILKLSDIGPTNY